MVSIVIPTYKRKDSLIRLMESIKKQLYLPEEVLVIAAGYAENELDFIATTYTNATVYYSTPSVCRQRNMGILKSTSDYVLLCDDDIELPEDYIKKLTDHIKLHPKVNIVTGTELIEDNYGKWNWVDIPISNKKLIFSYIFGLSIWSDLTKQKKASNPVVRHVAKQYSGNGISKAGWPFLTSFTYPILKTSIYGLGCSIIRREILSKNLFNEDLDRHGIGDNYEVALKINGKSQKIEVLRTVGFYHHKEKSNRYQQHKSYFHRSRGLELFLRKLPYFRFKNRLYFIWSLIGNGLMFLLRGRFKLWRSNTKVMVFTIANLFSK